MGNTLTTYKTNMIQLLLSDISASNNHYYVFASHPQSWLDENVPPGTTESLKDSVIESQSKMIFGKRVEALDVRLLTKRHDWQPGTVYAQYSAEEDISNSNFYVITDERKVYKCLFNADGAQSLFKPVISQNLPFTLLDGYVWKYMFTVSVADLGKYGTSDYIPVTANSDVTDAATDGIDIINVMATGNNYLTVHEGLIQSVSNTTLFRIENSASSADNFYAGSSFYMKSGPGQGGIAIVKNYYANTSGRWCLLETPLLNVQSSTSQYYIAPRVKIDGDGTGAVAISRVTDNKLSAVTVINPGTGYTRASVSIVANTYHGAGANVVASISPIGGHGYDLASELFCDAAAIHTVFAQGETGKAPTDVTYRRTGLLKNPIVANTVDEVYSANSFSRVFKCSISPAVTFERGDEIYGLTSGATGIVINSNNTSLSLVGDNHFQPSETITSVQHPNLITQISSVASVGDIDPKRSNILYINNSSPVQRANTQTETIKLVLKLQ